MQNSATYSFTTLPIEYHNMPIDSSSSTVGLISTSTQVNTNSLTNLYTPQSINFDSRTNYYPAQLAYEHYCAAATLSYSMSTPNFTPFQLPKIYPSITNNNLTKLNCENNIIKQKINQEELVNQTINKNNIPTDYQEPTCSNSNYFFDNSMYTNPLYYSPQSNMLEIEKFGIFFLYFL